MVSSNSALYVYSLVTIYKEHTGQLKARIYFLDTKQGYTTWVLCSHQNKSHKFFYRSSDVFVSKGNRFIGPDDLSPQNSS